MYKVISPLKVKVSKNKYFILNLNNYRNTYYRTLNNAKINYKAAVALQLKDKPFYPSVGIIYQVYKGDKRRHDIGNVLSVHQKFFEDALVELGKVPDDNSDLIPLVVYLDGGIDREAPRVDIEVYDLANRDDCQSFWERFTLYLKDVEYE